MPRKGEFARAWVQPPVVDPPPSRIGPRVVQAPANATRPGGVIAVDPSPFRCAGLVGELADEWVSYARLTGSKRLTLGDYRTAIVRFATWLDRHAERPESLTFAAAAPDVAALIRDWARQLPAAFRPGSPRPAQLTENIRALIRLRAQREDVVVGDEVRRLLVGPPLVRRGRTQELDEFTRQDRKTLVRAAWADVRALEERLARGAALLEAADGDPFRHGPSLANLLWTVAHDAERLPSFSDLLPLFPSWPAPLREMVDLRGRRVRPNTAIWQLSSALASLLFPRAEDLQAFRVLLVAATGHAPEELTALTEQDIEFTDGGVRLTLTKLRARQIRYRMFRTRETVAHDAYGPVDTAEVLRRLTAVGQQARDALGRQPAPLFTCATVWHSGQLRLRTFNSGGQGHFGDWVRDRGLTISGRLDLRRMRKTVKVEKAVTLRGSISDLADDHTAETFWGHYAHGTTLHLISAQAITRAQRTWLDRALAGPIVLDEPATEHLDDDRALHALGLTREQVEQLRAGEMDMGVTDCRSPYSSPYTKTGELCSVAPLRCLECRNAIILPSNLPQLLLFADHLAAPRNRLPPPAFHAAWGQSEANLHALLAERSPTEIDAARRRITQTGLRLQLPLAAFTEFDR
ncbi:hypothetical protein E1258_13450 [Micromonospora sp. KC207]|uniref:hypothetical protein n=1 Tax=Micromonospora sp. KC207 TaxID=2530377 RepID=UPI0010470399|nr:hypothetical protein [Micromonospora sp. KC207]TDC60868.1 hypothetical protein E1258_13450 [Micromonospora sp. KC207]